MPHFKDTNGKLHFIEDLQYSYLLPSGSVEITEEEVQIILAPTPEEIENSYINAIQSFMDSKAQEKNYDNIKSAALRAALPDSPFHNEGLAAGTWMDNCWALSYQILAEVKVGTRQMPTVEELINMMPELMW